MVLTTQIIGTEAPIGATPDSVGNASCVRVYNNNASDVVVSITSVVAPPAVAVTVSLTVKTKDTIFLKKLPTSVVSAPTSCLMTSVGF